MRVIKIDNENLLKGIEALEKYYEIPDFVSLYIEKGEKLIIKWQGDDVYITYPVNSALFRALSLISLSLNKNEKEDIEETLYFDECGVMLDMSRNGVMKVEAVKKYADMMALMGLNQLYLYLEDTYEIDGCPYFGYLRGRYTKEELREIDEYCDLIGIEAIPHIQALGHMEQYIKWDEGMQYRDTEKVLIAGEERTYDFIKKAITSISSCFKTKKIHLGMDEAGNLGSGKYYAKHGPIDRKEILLDHLKRVADIAEELGLTPIIYGDVIYAVATGNQYAAAGETKIPEDVKKRLPKDLVLTYWEYYDYDYDLYKNMLESYRDLTGKAIFWGGIWTWFGLAPDNKMTIDTTNPALKACKDTGIRAAIGSIWADDGCECNHFFGMHGLMYFAEHMYNYEVDEVKFKERFEYITKASFDAFTDMSYFHNDFDKFDDYNFYWERFYGKRFVFADLLIGLLDEDLRTKPMYEHYKNLENKFKTYIDTNNPWNEMYVYILKLIEIAKKKCFVLENLKIAYDNKNNGFLKDCVFKYIPELISDFESLEAIHKKQWMSTYKPFGFEVLDIRYGGVIQRLKSSLERIKAYIDGEIEIIEELSETRLLHRCEWTQRDFHAIVTACNGI